MRNHSLGHERRGLMYRPEAAFIFTGKELKGAPVYRRRGLLASSLLVAVTCLMVVLGAGPVQAHDHPTPVELDAPGVVQVQTYAQVSISLIEHNRAGAHIGLTQRTYTPLLRSGSGFAVDASATIVTSPAVIEADFKRAEIYAVNKIFNERYGDAAPMPSDPFATQSIPDLDPANAVNARLQRCYQSNSTDDTGGCVVFSTRVVKVLPFVTSQEQYGNLAADVLLPTPDKASEVAVLRVGGGSMPTVDLGTTSDDVTAFSALGFTQTPTDEKSLSVVIGHLPTEGATEVAKDEDYDALLAALSAGLHGGPIVGERGQVVGFLTGPADKPGDLAAGLNLLLGPDKIRTALAEVGVEARRGPTDAVYESAMHNYKNQLYPASIPSFDQVLSFYPGHALATEKLAIAQQGGAGLTGAEASNGQTNTGAAQPGPAASWYERYRLPLLLGLVVLIALLVLAFWLSRRRRGQHRAGIPDEDEDDMIVLPPTPRPNNRPAAMPAQGTGRPRQPSRPPGMSHPSNPGGQETSLRSLPALSPTEVRRPRPAQYSVNETMQRATPSFGPAPSSGPAQAVADSTPCSACGHPVPRGNAYCGHCAALQQPPR